GMDWLVLNAFFDALKENKPMPIDVYDMATWMAVTPLSEQSIKLGAAVEFPDFTNGKWVLA
ncbi:MAG: gfo/Idh/MocA family oxidoreductase, partial [Clostridia bacterium]|nr:gfo/Idh/MocA family oxidoreductase [Clostridia bacterium]